MITILERPQGHILDTTAKTATVSESYGAGDAQFVVTTVHGLTDGDWIYSVSDIEDYAGFFYVDVTTTGIFKLKTSANGDYVQFIAAGSITYYESNLTHGWSAVHLPITYKLSSNLYPVNGSDSSQTISSVVDYNGYSVIHISGSLGSGVNTYDFIKITVPNDTDHSGVYQIVEFISPTVLIINLEYDSTINWTSASALKHYNNYNIKVRIYAGLNASHQWAGIKPYELAATKELIPDENNECFFSINDILQSYITTRNNLGLGTLPNNIDFMTMFYIETAESYDDSDGYVFGTNVPSYTSDQATFEGYAVNADLEFKNLYSGYMSEYIMTNSAAKFLTLFTIPVLFSCSEDLPDCYSDISLIASEPISIALFEYYNNGVLQTSMTEDIDYSYPGVYRLPIDADCNYDRLDLTLKSFTNSSWAAQSSAANNQWRSAAYGNSLFVAVSNSGTGNRVMTSPDGITWTIRTSAADYDWISVTYGNGIFVAVAESGGTTDKVMTSSDGITWTLRTGFNQQWSGVTFGDGLFVAVSVSSNVMTSSDGINWVARTGASSNQWRSVIYGEGLFVAVSASGTGDRVMTSVDGITWVSRTSAADHNWTSITYGNGLFVAVNNSSVDNNMYSTDGITWALGNTPSPLNTTWASVAYGDGYFISVSSLGESMRSSDGITWESVTMPNANNYAGIGFGNGIFVAVSISGTGNRAMLLSVTVVSETKQFKIECGCSNQEIRLTWLNNLGGFEYWAFTAQKDHIIEIQAAIETKKNILPQWPKSYGSTADTIRKQTARISNKAYTVRSQFLTADEADAIAYIKSSVLVQIINSRLDRRTVIVDTDSFIKRKDGDKTFEVAFNISFTDDIPSQTV